MGLGSMHTLNCPKACKKHAAVSLAPQESPIFRIPSKQLVEAGVPVSDLKDAWQRGLLWALPIGTESTFPYDQRERWLEMALEDDCRDVLLSPRHLTES